MVLSHSLWAADCNRDSEVLRAEIARVGALIACLRHTRDARWRWRRTADVRRRREAIAAGLADLECQLDRLDRNITLLGPLLAHLPSAFADNLDALCAAHTRRAAEFDAVQSEWEAHGPEPPR